MSNDQTSIDEESSERCPRKGQVLLEPGIVHVPYILISHRGFPWNFLDWCFLSTRWKYPFIKIQIMYANYRVKLPLKTIETSGRKFIKQNNRRRRLL